MIAGTSTCITLSTFILGDCKFRALLESGSYKGRLGCNGTSLRSYGASSEQWFAIDKWGKVAKGAQLVFLLGGTVTRVASSMVGTLNCREQEELNRCFQTRWC